MQPDLASFVAWLSSVAQVTQTSPSNLLVSSFDGITLDPPARIGVTSESLDRLLDAWGDDALPVWPDIEPRVAAWRLLTVHVEELLTVDSRATFLLIDAPDVRAERIEVPPLELPPGDYVWATRAGAAFPPRRGRGGRRGRRGRRRAL